LKALSNDKKAMYVVVVDKKNKYLTAMTALRMDQSNITRQSLSVDRSMGITKTIVRKNADRTESEGKDVYVFEPDSRKFILVMTDALDEKPAELLNPIDTLSRKQKYTADYGTGKKSGINQRWKKK
jgi:meiotically up-regulated gene 157 (Mug157) protein